MKYAFLIALLFLNACASNEATPTTAEQSPDSRSYHADLATCQQWAAPTRHEWAARCAANGEMVMMSKIIASLSSDDPRDRDTTRQSLPNDTQARFNVCMKDKGYAMADPAPIGRLASR